MSATATIQPTVSMRDTVAGEGASAEARGRAPRRPRPRRDRKDHGRRRRRAAEIHAYVGPNGGGKTLAMVNDTLPTLDGEHWQCRVEDDAHTLAGIYEGVRLVYANIELYNPETGRIHSLYRHLDRLTDLLMVEHADVLLDEIMGVAPSRDTNGLPGEVAEFLQKLRHFDIRLRYTSPDYGSTHIDLRRPTKAVTECRGMVRDFARKDVAWAPSRLFNWRTFSAEDLRDRGLNDREIRRDDGSHSRVKPKVVGWMWGPGSRAFAAYETLGVVGILRTTLPSGICSRCGGRRTIPRCTCGD